MNPLRTLVEHLADRVHAGSDAQARAYGMTVERLPWGARRISDPRVAVHAAARGAHRVRRSDLVLFGGHR